jgi:hypothetical protein
MFTHHLITSLPGTFRVVVTCARPPRPPYSCHHHPPLPPSPSCLPSPLPYPERRTPLHLLRSCFGTPLLGYLTGARLKLLTEAAAARRTSLLSLHGRSDTSIPAQVRTHPAEPLSPQPGPQGLRPPTLRR